MSTTTEGPVQPLAGLRVLEVSSYVATPLSGLVLAQLGADVVRLEPPGGAPDRTRLPLSPTGTSLYWSGLNRGKRAIEVDLSTEAGRELAADLAVEAGVVIANALHRGAMAPEALRERRPDLIHVRLLGTADGGPAVDYTVQARTGLQQVTGPAGGGTPVNHVLPAWDVAAGLYLSTALLAAVQRRHATGQGSTITVALDDVAMATVGSLGQLTQAQIDHVGRGPDDNHVYGTYGRDFVTSDGRRGMLVILTERHWTKLLALTGLTDAFSHLGLALGADFTREEVRYEHRTVISALLEPWFAARTLAQATAELEANRLLWGPYRTFDEVGREDLATNPLFAPLDQPGVGPHLAPRSPIVIDGTRPDPRPAPAVGQHNAEVLGARGHRSTDHLSADQLISTHQQPQENMS